MQPVSGAPLDPTPIAKLRRIVAALEQGRQPDATDAAWFISGTREYQAGRLAGLETTLDRSLGMSRPTRHGWWAHEALAERDQLFREVRAACFPLQSDGAAAAAIAAGLRRARPGPVRGASPTRDDLWEKLSSAIMRTGRALPSRKQLTRILNQWTFDPPIKCP